MKVLEVLGLLTTAEVISLIGVVVALPAATYYPFMFARVRFWESDIGKSMFLKGVALASIIWLAFWSVFAFAYQWTWFLWLQTAANWILVIAVWFQVIVMRRVQRSSEFASKLDARERHPSNQPPRHSR